LSTFTYDDLRIRVSEFLSSSYHGTAGTGAAAVPIEVYTADVIDRVVNDGYKRFVQDHDWIFMTPLFQMTFVNATTGSVTTGGTGTFTDTAMTDTTGTHNGSSILIKRSTGSTFHTVVLTQTAAGVFTFADGNLVFATTDTYSLAASPAIRGDADRYLMPADFSGSILGPITYGGPAGTPRISLNQVDEGGLRELQSGDVSTSSEPVAIAFRPLDQENQSEEPRIEAVLWPTPQAQRTLHMRYRRRPLPLVLGTDRPITGWEHDMTLLACCKAEAEITRHDEVAIWGATYAALLQTSIKRDSDARPKSRGMMTNPEGGGIGFPFFRGTVDNINGTSITF
jgi:hypothetical protein